MPPERTDVKARTAGGNPPGGLPGQAPSRPCRAVGRRALALLLGLLIAIAPAPAALALTEVPPSTTGTASSVSPSTVAAGGAISFTLSGFPALARVEIVLDDGTASGTESTGGVLQEIRVREDGTASGALQLPSSISHGSHWLRFRVVALVPVSGEALTGASSSSSAESSATSSSAAVLRYGGVEPQDVTNRSPEFTVADVTVIGGIRSSDASGDSSEVISTAEGTPATTAIAAAPTVIASVPSDTGAAPIEVPGARSRDNRVTVLSVGGLVALNLAIVSYVLVRRRRRR